MQVLYPTPQIPLPECSVRLGLPEDEKAITTILQEGFPDVINPGFMLRDRLLSNNYLCCIILVGSVIVGVLESAVNNNNMYLFNLAVLPTFRNQGIASKLMDAMEAIALHLGIVNLYLHAIPELRLLKFYLKRGYQFLMIDTSWQPLSILLGKICQPKNFFCSRDKVESKFDVALIIARLIFT